LSDIVPGTTAARMVARGSLDADAAAALVELIAGALAAAHAIGVVHHALEPAVVHVGFAADRVIVRDFGLAALVEDGDGDAARAPYRAPELARDPASAGPAADVYALGCIAAELLAAAPALPVAPPQLVALIARMRVEDSAARPTAAEVAAELIALSRGASNVAVEATQEAQRRRVPTDPPPAAVHASAAAKLAPPPSRIARGPAWRCDRCAMRNARGHAFCLHCSAPAPALAGLAPADDIGAMMAALAAHGSDEVTPPPGPPPERGGDDDD
jgi:serine/threonine-protein kinase